MTEKIKAMHNSSEYFIKRDSFPCLNFIFNIAKTRVNINDAAQMMILIYTGASNKKYNEMMNKTENIIAGYLIKLFFITYKNWCCLEQHRKSNGV